MKHLLLLIILICTGCGVVTTRQQEVAAQSMADTQAAIKFITTFAQDESVRMAANAILSHVRNMAATIGVSLDELPGPRVSKSDWKLDPEGSSTQAQEDAKRDSEVSTNYGMWGMFGAAGITIAMLLVRIGTRAFASTPIGSTLGTIGTFFGQSHPVRDKIYDKITAALDDYKLVDPGWRDNKLFVKLSEVMTLEEKDFIKKQRHDG